MELLATINESLNNIKEAFQMKKKEASAVHIKKTAKARKTNTGRKENIARTNNYADFHSFFREKCSLVKGQYTAFNDVLDEYRLWLDRKYPNDMLYLPLHVIGRYIKRASKLRQVKSPTVNCLNTTPEGIFLSLQLDSCFEQVRCIYGELYRFKTDFLVETGRKEDVLRLEDVYKKYCRWCNTQDYGHYCYDKFALKLRQFLENKEVKIARKSIKGLRLRYIYGMTFA